MNGAPPAAPLRRERASAIHPGPLPRALCHAATLCDPAHGAVMTFLGVVRSRERGVVRLDYHCYRPMAERLLARFIDEAAERFDGALNALVVHGTGAMRPGDVALCIHVSCSHRASAFDACRHLRERIGQDLPVWTRAHYDDGSCRWSTGR